MKSLRIALVTMGLAIGGNALKAAAPGTDWADQWFRAKFGRISPAGEARQKAEAENTASREEPATEIARPAFSWTEQYFRTKFGRSSPQEAARQKAEFEHTAFRAETTAEAAPRPHTWTEQYFKAKSGRDIRIDKSGQNVSGKR